MTGSIDSLAIAMAVFLAIHAVPSTPLRAALVERLGERPYIGLFSLASIAALAWVGFAYGGAPYQPLWQAGPWAAWFTFLVTPFAFVLLACGYLTTNPTAVMQEKHLQDPDPAPGILKVTRHPLMMAIALWALAHIPPNGDLASLILFGGLGLLAGFGTLLIDARKERQAGAAWGPMKLTTSVIPFQAIVEGRNRVTPAQVGWWRIAVGLALWVGFLALHPFAFGVSPLPQ